MSYYKRFNMNLTDIDHVILEREIFRALIRGSGPIKGDTVKDSHRNISIYNPKELAERVKTYINMEMSNEHESALKRYPMRLSVTTWLHLLWQRIVEHL